MKNVLNGPFDWIKNIGSLSVLRIFEYSLPLLTFPVIVRVLGPEIYGKWVYAQVVVSFFALASNLGLIIYGEREIAAHRKSSEELIPSILSLQIILSLISYVVLICSLFLLKPDNISRWLILLLGLTLVINSLFSLNWIFTGWQRFDKIAVLQALSQAISAGGILLFLRHPEEVWILPILACLGSLSAGCWGWRWLHKEGIQFRLSFTPRKWGTILQVSLYYSFASFMSLIYNKADHLILPWLKGTYVLGQYGACYRLMGAFLGIMLMGTSVFGPYAAAVSSKAPERFGEVLHKGLLILNAISLPVASGSILFSNEIVSLVLGQKYLESEGLFRVLALIIPLGSWSSFFAGALLFAPGHHRRYAVAVTLGAVANMLLNVLLIPPFGAIGAAVATLVAQATVATGAAYMGRQYLEGIFSRNLIHPFVATFVMLLILARMVPLEIHILFKVALGASIYFSLLWALDWKDGRELSNLLLSSIGRRNVRISTP
jgi:O-antigen/teichoic acid export membrane protein